MLLDERGSGCAAADRFQAQRPAPANRSIACSPMTRGPMRLNTALRTWSFIGLVRGSPL